MDADRIGPEHFKKVLRGCHLVFEIELDLLFFNTLFNLLKFFLKTYWRQYIKVVVIRSL